MALCRWCRPLRAWVDPLLFVAGIGQAFFLPLLGALALGLVGHAALNRTMGHNQGWNHAGNLAAALLAMGPGQPVWCDLRLLCGAHRLLPGGRLRLHHPREEIDEDRASGAAHSGGKGAGLRELLKDRRVWCLLVTTALFHLANAPVMPFLGTYIKKLKGS